MLTSELDVLRFWRENKIFEKSVEKNKSNKPFVVYDGPPFATGLPHWGHIMISQVKDTVLRYQTQKGRYVPRRWGWDCHGVPIEKIVEKELNVEDKREIENTIGIERFNQICRDKVMTYDGEWRKVIERIGRWVDMDDQYRTMDSEYIESVWWGLGQLWQKGLLFKDYRISLYSPSVGVPLSHTDVAMEVKYENETINSPIVRFKVKPDSAKKLLSKVLEQISFNYSEQLRYKADIEKRVATLEKGAVGKKTRLDEIIKSGLPEFDAIDWDNFHTEVEASEELKHLKAQYEIVLENIDTLNRLQKILASNFPVSLLSWTTTPWTFPANVALAIGAEIEYSLYYLGATSEMVLLSEKKAVPILSLQLHEAVINSPELQEELQKSTDSSQYFQKLGVDIIKVVSFKGSDLAGLEYQPLFEPTQKIESYEEKANIFKVYTADYVSDEEGTGVVQIAPAYGQDDFDLKQKWNLPVLTCLNEYGEMRDDLNPEVRPAFGKNYLEANSIISDILNKKGNLFTTILYTHRVPIYDRDGKKVYYSAQEGWFIAETKLRSRSLELNEEINWHPEKLKHGRFGKGLETAPEWSISRSRYWGTPIPIWQTEGGDKTLFIDSLEKLEKYAVNPIYKLINISDLTPELYENGHTVILGDSQTKLPLGINAVNYRSKNLMEMRKLKELNMQVFAEFAQKILEEILELFNKYKNVQPLFTKEEQKMWTTWLLTLHPESKKVTKNFYFYKSVAENDGEFKPQGSIKLLDLHRPYIDQIILQDEVGNIYYRIKDVLDTWGDSGSMPFASWHYPFENKAFVENNLPADWITEGQDQTRGWFRVLHVLSTGIFNTPAFKNVNTTGMILAEDGKKMSKSKKNYTDPAALIEKFGADSVRNYLLSSTILNAEGLNFKDTDLQTVFRETTLLLSNSSQYISFVLGQQEHRALPEHYKHPLNIWWKVYTQNYAKQIDEHLSKYEIAEASRLVIPYIRDFSTWYIRRSKDLLETHGLEVASCIKESIKLFAIVTASLQPFNSERLWSILRDNSDFNSVHLTDFPALSDLTKKEQQILADMEKLREIVSEIHGVRKEKNIRVRQPLYADFSSFNLDSGLLEIVIGECNLLKKDLSKTEGQIFTHESSFGTIKVDLVVDESLSVLGYIRDFERAVQAFRKKQGFKPGELVKVDLETIDVQNEGIFSEVVAATDWAKLCLEVKWVKGLDVKTDKSFEIKGLAKILVD
jgi:isoleucyl-tRNA synthetase